MISLNLGNPSKSEKRELTIEQFPALRALMGPPVAAGVAVNQTTAKSISAYYCMLNVISADIGVLDRSLEELVGEDEDPRAAKSHPAYKVIHDSPNDWMTPQVFWQTLTGHALSWGMGYAEIEWDGAQRPIAMWPITPDRVEPTIDTRISKGKKVSRLFYLVDGKTELAQEDAFVLPGLGFDGIRGYSLVQMARQSLGLSIATERFGAATFGNGAAIGVVFQHPEEMSEEAQKRFASNISDYYQGPDRANKVLVLEEGMKISKPITIPPDDCQFLETRSFQVEEVARWGNIPVFKLHHKEGERPGGSIEAGQIEYATSTLMPWTTRIEQEALRKLVKASARQSYRITHDFKKLLMADTAVRAAAEKLWVDMGAIDAAHVARIESFPKPKPKAIAEPPAPALAPAAAAQPAPAPEVDPERSAEDPATRSLRLAQEAWFGKIPTVREAHRAGVLDRVSQYVRREAERVRGAAKKAPAELEAWAEDFYRREETVLAGVLAPLMRMSLVLAGSDDDHELVAADEARVHLTSSKDEVLSMRAKDRTFEAEKMTQRWEATRAQALTDRVMALAQTKEASYGA